ncbi:hypothetical protein C8D89_111108 [Actinomycetospora cinnamomea]|uniref:Uncharacterized protein n=1 Tax=Actinomycetospora cinnamomea TaxID=663609 RepID=A0A2U1F6B8_9PSEU|nr:hypothetical protein C8D89_111108 [Actinomycetospora cinnamomea]
MVAGPYTSPETTLPLTWADHRASALADTRATTGWPRVSPTGAAGEPPVHARAAVRCGGPCGGCQRRGCAARWTTAGGRLRQTTGDVSTSAKHAPSSARSARAGVAQEVAQ